MNIGERLMANSLRLVVPPVAGASLLLFGVFLFNGSLGLIALNLSEPVLLAWDGFLSLLFFLQHSGMVRRGFKARLSNFFPSYCNDALYALASGIVLTAVVVLWQPSATVWVELDGVVRWAARGVFFIGVIGTAWGARALGLFDPFGGAPIKDRFNGKSRRPQKLSISGPYLWVRHPLYFFTLLLVWSYPVLTSDRLLFNLLWTAWIVTGTVLEERDLLSDFGDDYRQYQSKVPMLIPWKGRGNDSR